MKHRIAALAAIVMVALMGQVTAERSVQQAVADGDFVGIMRLPQGGEEPQYLGIIRLLPGEEIPEEAVLRVEFSLHNHGGDMWACLGGATPPNCRVYGVPPNTPDCGLWPAQVTDYFHPYDGCNTLGMTFNYTIWLNNGQNGPENVGTVTVTPQLIDPTTCYWAFYGGPYDMYLQRCAPSPTPTPRPTSTPRPRPTMTPRQGEE